jgi:hypothetical protein
MNNYSLYQVIGFGGELISRHRTEEAARAVVDRQNRAIRRVPGMQSSYSGWWVQAPEED